MMDNCNALDTLLPTTYYYPPITLNIAATAADCVGTQYICCASDIGQISLASN